MITVERSSLEEDNLAILEQAAFSEKEFESLLGLYADRDRFSENDLVSLYSLYSNPKYTLLVKTFLLFPAMYGFANIGGMFNRDFEHDFSDPALLAAHIIYFACAIYSIQPYKRMAEAVLLIDEVESNLHFFEKLSKLLDETRQSVINEYPNSSLKDPVVPTASEMLFFWERNANTLSPEQEQIVALHNMLVYLVLPGVIPMANKDMAENIVYGSARIESGRPVVSFTHSREGLPQVPVDETLIKSIIQAVFGEDKEVLSFGLGYWKTLVQEQSELVRYILEIVQRDCT